MRFAPQSLGLRSDSLTLRTSAGVVLAQAGMTGTGVPLDATLTISPTSHDFGTLPVGSATVSQVFTVTNTGTTASAALVTAGSAQTPGGPSLSL